MRRSIITALFLAVIAVAAAVPAFAGTEKTLPDGHHQVTLSVPDMECAMCIRSVQSEMKHTEGVVECRIDDINRLATVKFDPATTDVKRIQAAIRKAGFASHPVEPPTH